MTTVLIDHKSPREKKIPKYANHRPQIMQIVSECDNTPLPEDEELISLGEFKAHMEDLAYKRLGLKLTL